MKIHFGGEKVIIITFNYLPSFPSVVCTPFHTTCIKKCVKNIQSKLYANTYTHTNNWSYSHRIADEVNGTEYKMEQIEIRTIPTWRKQTNNMFDLIFICCVKSLFYRLFLFHIIIFVLILFSFFFLLFIALFDLSIISFICSAKCTFCLWWCRCRCIQSISWLAIFYFTLPCTGMWKADRKKEI